MGLKENVSVCSAFFSVQWMLDSSPLSPRGVLAKPVMFSDACGTFSVSGRAVLGLRVGGGHLKKLCAGRQSYISHVDF